MENPTLFGKILRGEIPADVVFEDELCLAFRDISPQAPVHILIIPKKWLPSIGHAGVEDKATMGHLMWAAAEIARAEGLAETGYRVLTNVGEHGQQSVEHLHLHLIGGRQLTWPPG